MIKRKTDEDFPSAPSLLQRAPGCTVTCNTAAQLSIILSVTHMDELFDSQHAEMLHTKWGIRIQRVCSDKGAW